MSVAQAICGMRPDGVRMTMAHLSRVEDLSKEEALSFANQIGEWFGTAARSRTRHSGCCADSSGLATELRRTPASRAAQ
jgi:hypothetical protein